MIRLAIKKSKGKEWYSIVSPKFFGGKEIGKTMSAEPEKIVGRVLSLSAIDLINDLNKYHLKFMFRVSKVDGNTAITDFEGFECLQDFISRMVLRRIRRIDVVQDIKMKDGTMARVKILATISKKATSSVEKSVRAFIHQFVKEEVERLTLEQFLKKVISNSVKCPEGIKIYLSYKKL